MKNRRRANRCQALNSEGKPCGAAAMPGGLCFFHANPKKAAQLGRIGGRSHGRAASALADPLPKLDTLIAVQETISQVIGEVRAGKLDPKVAASITPLLHLQWQVLEVTTALRRVAELEEILDANQEAGQLQTEVLKTKAPAETAKPSSYAASGTA